MQRKSHRSRRRSKWNRRRVIAIGVGLLVFAMLISFLNKPHNAIESGEPEKYFQSMAPYAQHYGGESSIFPSLILAQSALESDFGRSQLSANYNNYFGIKQTGNEASVTFNTLEHENGSFQEIQAGFRSYRNVAESVSDYTKLISSYDRYAGVRNASTPEEAAYALVHGGYATDPGYAEKIIKLIHDYELKRFDSLSLEN